MKKVAQFRRSNGPNAGFSEKLAWQLSKGPATGRELAQQLSMTLSEFNRLVLHIIRRGGETLQVEASNQVCLGGGSIDRTYTLVRNPRRVAPRHVSQWLSTTATTVLKRLLSAIVKQLHAGLV